MHTALLTASTGRCIASDSHRRATASEHRTVCMGRRTPLSAPLLTTLPTCLTNVLDVHALEALAEHVPQEHANVLQQCARRKHRAGWPGRAGAPGRVKELIAAKSSWTATCDNCSSVQLGCALLHTTTATGACAYCGPHPWSHPCRAPAGWGCRWRRCPWARSSP